MMHSLCDDGNLNYNNIVIGKNIAYSIIISMIIYTPLLLFLSVCNKKENNEIKSDNPFILPRSDCDEGEVFLMCRQ